MLIILLSCELLVGVLFRGEKKEKENNIVFLNIDLCLL